MLVEEIEKAWAARAKSAPFYSTPTFVGDALTLGAGTEIARRTTAVETDHKSQTFEAPVIALLAATFLRRIDRRAVAHLRLAFEKRARGDDLSASVHLAMMGLPRLGRGDAAARRLFAADCLISAGVTPETVLAALDLDPAPLRGAIHKYDPDQPRVPAGNGRTSGQWTSEGGPQGEAAAAAAVAVRPASAGLAEAGSFFSATVARRALVGLAQLALDAAGPVAVFGMVMVTPSPSKSPIEEGLVPGRKDLKYEWLQDEGVLLLHRLISGQWVTVAEGRMDLQGVFHDRAGKPFARVVNGVLAIDIAAASQAEKDENEQEQDEAAAAAAAIARTKASTVARTKEKAKLCPDPATEDQTGWSENAKEYQSRVAKLPRGLAIRYNNVDYDGCDEDGDDKEIRDDPEDQMKLLEAKSNLKNMVGPDGNWKPFFRYGWPDGKSGWPKMQKQIWDQIEASDGHRVEWHFQVKVTADIVSAWAAREGLPKNFLVKYDPTGYGR